MIKKLTYKGKQSEKPLSSEYWITKTDEERLNASADMTAFAFQIPEWWLKPMVKKLTSKRKHASGTNR